MIRPILWTLPLYSVNHSAPSGPAVIPVGWALALGTGNSLTCADAIPGHASATIAAPSRQLTVLDDFAHWSAPRQKDI